MIDLVLNWATPGQRERIENEGNDGAEPGIEITRLPAISSVQITDKMTSSNSMSGEYHQQGVLINYTDGFGRSGGLQPGQHNPHNPHVAHQIRKDKLSMQGFEAAPPHQLVAIEEDEATGMLSEMFTFQPPDSVAAQNYVEWYGDRDENDEDSADQGGRHHISSMNAESAAAAMQFFLMNPNRRSPSPQPTQPPSQQHILLPAPPISLHGFPEVDGAGTSMGSFGTWVPCGEEGSHRGGEVGGLRESQGLSLSLSSSLQAAAAIGGEQVHGSFGPPLGMMNILVRNTRYVKAAQELLEEFCSVGGRENEWRGNRSTRNSQNHNSNHSGSGSSSSSKDPSVPLSATDKMDHQRRKIKLLSMLDEVDRRYAHYCEQMQMVVNSFDMVMGYGAALPYTSMAQKAMSRHFRCLKDAVTAELKKSCEILGEKDSLGACGLTKGETPRLRLLEQSLRQQQRAFNQLGMEQEAWRPQRGLPERSVNVLRAWLFEHFLHPYPSDADKHLLARQTSLSRNQVSNWFINARVRLWKPMVEEMYQQEAVEKQEEDEEAQEGETKQSCSSGSNNTGFSSRNPTPTVIIRPEINAMDNDPSLLEINNNNQDHPHYSSQNLPRRRETTAAAAMGDRIIGREGKCGAGAPACRTTRGPEMGSSTLIRFGTMAGDVSLTLGLRHAGNIPESSPFTVDFGSC